MTTHVYGKETMTIFDQRASLVEALQGHSVCISIAWIINDYHEHGNMIITNLLLPLGHISNKSILSGVADGHTLLLILAFCWYYLELILVISCCCSSLMLILLYIVGILSDHNDALSLIIDVVDHFLRHVLLVVQMDVDHVSLGPF